LSLTRPSVVHDLLARHQLRPSQSLGQNFLVDEHHLEKIVAAACLDPGDVVLEIGPGLGTLTARLAAQAGSVIAVEKDRRLQPVLQETVGHLPNVRLVFADALEVDYPALLSEGRAAKVVANLPYYITTPVLETLLRCSVPWQLFVFLVQKEVAERLQAGPGRKQYGVLTVLAQFYAQIDVVAQVPGSAFFPAPRVTSAVVRLTPHDPIPWALRSDLDRFADVVSAAFGQRRKTLVNALSAGLGIERQELRQVLARLGWPEGRRGESLSVAEFVELTNQLPR
jgi:16S rRNA (adenine1518-N6/adenine1519-N6)-dimethyltransferase